MKWFWVQATVATALMFAMVVSALYGEIGGAVLYGFLAIFVQNTMDRP